MTDDIRPLRLAAGLLIATGAVVGLGAVPGIGWPIWAAHDLIVWPYDGGGAASIPESRLFAAICGGVLVGWGVMIWQLAPLVPRNGVLRRIVWTSILAWFVVDSALSTVAGGALNLIPNLAFLGVFWWALRPRQAVAPT